MHKIAVVVFAFVFLALGARPAGADERGKARAAFRAGSQHYNLGEFQQALDSFREAYRNVEDPTFLFNIAQCERQLGHKREAIREYRAYLNNAESASNRESVQQTIVQLQKEVDEEDQRVKAAAEAAEAAKPSVTPAPVITPTLAPTAATPALVASAPPPAEHKPAYKRWWVWTIVGGVVVAGAAATAAVLLTRPSTPTAPTTLGTAHPF